MIALAWLWLALCSAELALCGGGKVVADGGKRMSSPCDKMMKTYRGWNGYDN